MPLNLLICMYMCLSMCICEYITYKHTHISDNRHLLKKEDWLLM